MKTFSHCPICSRQIKRQFLMCGPHWYQVPQSIRNKIWKHYQAGQEEGVVKPTETYYQAMKEAIEVVKRQEGRRK